MEDDRVSAERVKQIFYDPIRNGVLYWLINVGSRGIKDEIAGYTHFDHKRDEFRWTIQFGGRKYLRSNLVFALYKGRWALPGLVIDHFDKDTLNDCIGNLRELTQSQNMETRVYRNRV